MVLWACGWSYLLLAAFYLVIDVLGFRKWSFFFIVIGSNAILAYIGGGSDRFRPHRRRLCERSGSQPDGDGQPMLQAIRGAHPLGHLRHHLADPLVFVSQRHIRPGLTSG